MPDDFMGPPVSRQGGGGFLGGLASMFGGGFLPGLGGLLGGLFNQQEFGQAREDILGLNSFTDQSFASPFGQGFAGAGGQNAFSFDPAGQANFDALNQSIPGLLGGGLFNDPRFQQAFQQNDIAGALGQANQAFGVQQGGQAFGGLEGLFNQQAGLGQFFGDRVAQGPQDFSGGLMAQLLGQGAANQAAAGDSQAIFDAELANFRQAAEPSQTRFIQDLENRLFSQGRLGSTGGAQQFGAGVDEIGRQDLGFQSLARQTGLGQQNFLANLGSAQIGQGAGFLGQNLGQFNQESQLANLFNQGAAGIEGQAFGQQLGANQFNTSQGQNRLQAAMGLFGQGNQVFGDQFGLGLGAFGSGIDQQRAIMDLIFGLRGGETDRIGASGQGSLALANLQTQGGGGFGDFLGGLFS